MVSVEQLYDLCDIIDGAGEAASKHESEYEEILTAVKGSPAERRLSSQFISRFFTLFPSQQEQALNAMFDLCEDEDLSIRKQVIKDLPKLCKAKPSIISKVSDILAQLFQMEDQGELVTIQNTLTILLKLDVNSVLTGLLYQIKHTEEELVKERSMKFLQSKLKSFGSEIFKPESEELILKEAKAILPDANEEEFLLMMGILKELKITKSPKGYQQMVDLVAAQCDLTQSVDPTDLESMHRLSSCLKQALPYFSSQIRSTKFVDYMCREVMPFVNQLEATAVTAEQGSTAPKLDLLRTFAEFVAFADPLEDIEEKVATVFAQLLELMPLPPETSSTDETIEDDVSMEFSRVECLLFIFHQLAKQHQSFLADNPERLKDFRSRLQYFARGSHAYQKKLREALDTKKGEDAKSEENVIKEIALKTTLNINTLIKDLFHQPPSYKSSVTLSWKEVGNAKSGEKRHPPISSDSPSPKNPKSERAIYAPPRDKYSRGVARGRGRGRGGPRIYGSYRGAFGRY